MDVPKVTMICKIMIQEPSFQKSVALISYSFDSLPVLRLYVRRNQYSSSICGSWLRTFNVYHLHMMTVFIPPQIGKLINSRQQKNSSKLYVTKLYIK